MSRSKKKVAIYHICYGNNTPYYKAARKHLRTLMKRELQKLKHHSIEEIDEKIMGFQNKHDTKYDEWNEPTDGTYLVRPNGREFSKEEIEKLKRK